MAFKEKIKLFFLLHSVLALFFIIFWIRAGDNILWLLPLYIIIETAKIFYLVYCSSKTVGQLEMALHKSEEVEIKNDELFDKEAQLAALQSQINPHFLYNTLESIRGQALVDDNIEIAKMMEVLSSFFRYSISRSGKLVTLREELANIQNYMMIQRYRFSNRFSLDIFIDEEDEKALDYFIPKLIIQPMVENAIFHGLEEHMDGGKVIIEVIVTENNLILTVSDNGKGIKPEILAELNRKIQSSNQSSESNENKQRNTGIGLPNIHKRIQLLWGKEYGVSVFSTLNQGTDVEITIPINDQKEGLSEDEERSPSH